MMNEMNKSSFVILGEASESDEEDFMRPIGKVTPNPHSSDDELNIAVGAFVSKAEELSEVDDAKYNTLLHKKLKESNWKLKEDMKYFVKSSLKYASDQINEINQSLLSSQIETQDSILHRRRCHAALEKTDSTLSMLLSYQLVQPTISN